jgi:hypothetical protein
VSVSDKGGGSFRSFPCAVGDVIVRATDGAEAWLAGAVVLREDAPVAALFVAPDAKAAGGDRAIYARARPVTHVDWLVPTAPESLAALSEPPSALEIDGVRFDRVRRLPLRAAREGTNAPDVGATAIVGEYAAPGGEVALILVSDGHARAWRGRRLAAGDYEVWRPPGPSP